MAEKAATPGPRQDLNLDILAALSDIREDVRHLREQTDKWLPMVEALTKSGPLGWALKRQREKTDL